MADSNTEKLNQPVAYIDWVQSRTTAATSESQLFNEYNKYVTDWYKTNAKDNKDSTNQIINLYKNLLQEITLYYSDPEERRFLSNIDFDNTDDLDVAIPYFVKKIKQITRYLVKTRQDVQFAPIKHNLKGSERGINDLLKSEIISLLTSEQFTGQYPRSVIPAASAVSEKLKIEVEPLYDLYQNYFDIDPSVSNKTYTPELSTADSNVSTSLKPFFNTRYDSFDSNTELLDPDVILNLTGAIAKLFNDNPVHLTSDGDGISTAAACCILANVPRSDLDQLPDQYFVDGIHTLENLRIVYQAKLIEKYAGTKMYYLSTGDTTTNLVSGILYQPKNTSANLLNRHFSSHASAPDLSQLKSEKDIGGFFTSTKNGVLFYSSIDMTYDIDTASLEADTLYVFPDPKKYGSRGNTKTDQQSPYIHKDSVRGIKATRANQKLHGDIIRDQDVQKFYPYQSREDTLKYHPSGVSRSIDSVDFWTGDKKDIWSHSDIYPLRATEPVPITEKLQSLLISDDVVSQWKTDIYGNEYALFKRTHAPNQTKEQLLGNLVSSSTQDTTTRDELINPDQNDLFQPLNTNFYNYQLSSYTTMYKNSAGALPVDKSIYNRQADIYGTLYFRNINSDTIGTLHSTLSNVFIKYSKSTGILDEVYNKVKHFDLIGDTLILETQNFLIIERLKYNQMTSDVTSSLSKQLYISLSGTNPSFEKFSNIWYDDTEKDIILCKTVLHPHLSGSNYKVIYPNIYRYNTLTDDFKEVFGIETLRPANSGTDDQSTFNLLVDNGFSFSKRPLTDAQVEIDITEIERPTISHNRQDSTYSITMMGSDAGDKKYLYNFYFDTLLSSDKFTSKQLTVFKPIYDVIAYNLHHHATLSGMDAYIEGPLDRGSLTETYDISWITNVSELPSVNEIANERHILSFSDTGLSGRPYGNPDRYILSAHNTALMGAGLSTGNDGMIVSGTPVLPYSHHTSYLLSNNALSATGGDIEISFDIALYTNTLSNSGYMQAFTTIRALQAQDNTFLTDEDGVVIFQD